MTWLKNYKFKKRYAYKKIYIYGSTLTSSIDMMNFIALYVEKIRKLKIVERTKTRIVFKNEMTLNAVKCNDNVRGIRWDECFIDNLIPISDRESLIFPKATGISRKGEIMPKYTERIHYF
jgi:hypothetical protein